MAESHPVFKIISASVACAGVVFGIVQYMQVMPLERDLAIANQKLISSKEKVKLTEEYQTLNNLYQEAKARYELTLKELENKSSIEVKNIELKLELKNLSEKLSQFDKYENYDELSSNLEQTKSSLEQYKKAYAEYKDGYESLLSKLDLKEDLASLKKDKKHLETILDCMTHGCNLIPYTYKYDKKYDSVAFEQFKHQLDEANRQISLLYEGLNKRVN